jgi:hypothetical protein
MPRKDEEEPLDEYIKYASKLRGTPEDFEDWAVDNNIKLPTKRKTIKHEDGYDDSE